MADESGGAPVSSASDEFVGLTPVGAVDVAPVEVGAVEVGWECEALVAAPLLVWIDEVAIVVWLALESEGLPELETVSTSPDPLSPQAETQSSAVTGPIELRRDLRSADLENP